MNRADDFSGNFIFEVRTLLCSYINENLPELAFLKCCMIPIFGPFSKFPGR